MKNLTDSEKKDILITALQERYEAMRVIRERVQSIGIWVMGLMLSAAGWLIQNHEFMSLDNRLLYLFVLGVVFWALRFEYLLDLQKGFSSQQRVAAHIEKVLGFYTPGVFDNTEGTIYPISWDQAGKSNGEGKFFGSTYLLLYIGFLVLSLAILIHSSNIFCWLL